MQRGGQVGESSRWIGRQAHQLAGQGKVVRSSAYHTSRGSQQAVHTKQYSGTHLASPPRQRPPDRTTIAPGTAAPRTPAAAAPQSSRAGARAGPRRRRPCPACRCRRRLRLRRRRCRWLRGLECKTRCSAGPAAASRWWAAPLPQGAPPAAAAHPARQQPAAAHRQECRGPARPARQPRAGRQAGRQAGNPSHDFHEQ